VEDAQRSRRAEPPLLQKPTGQTLAHYGAA